MSDVTDVTKGIENIPLNDSSSEKIDLRTEVIELIEKISLEELAADFLRIYDNRINSEMDALKWNRLSRLLVEDIKREKEIWGEDGLIERLHKVRDQIKQSDCAKLKEEQKQLEQNLSIIVGEQGDFRCLPWPNNDWLYAYDLWKSSGTLEN